MRPTGIRDLSATIAQTRIRVYVCARARARAACPFPRVSPDDPAPVSDSQRADTRTPTVCACKFSLRFPPHALHPRALNARARTRRCREHLYALQIRATCLRVPRISIRVYILYA